MSGPKLFAQLTKVDEARREVWGRLVQETPDRSDEIFDYESSKPYFKAWSDSFAEATDGKSLGNLRAMHGKVSAGKFIALDYNDTEKAIDVGAKVVDDNEWTKVLEGCYTGFSIGGSYVGEKKTEKIGDVEVRRYTAKPVEGSLVDLPCVPTAKFFDIVKADGAVMHKEFRAPVEEKTEEPIDVKGTADEIVTFGKLLNERNLSMGEAIALVKDGILAKPLIESDTDEARSSNIASEIKSGKSPEQAAAIAYSVQRKAKRAKRKTGKDASPEAVEKGMYAVQMFADCLSMLADVARSAEDDLQWEEDASPIPQKMRAWMVEGVALFSEMADEEATELITSLKAAVGDHLALVGAIKEASAAGALIKRANDSELSVVDLVKLADAELTEDERKPLKSLDDLRKAIVAKAAGKMSAANMDRLQAAHDHLAAMGASCGSTKSAPVEEVNKASDVAAQLSEALDRIKKLEAQPMPSVVTLRMAKTITKEQDQERNNASTINPDTVELLPADLVRNADGSVDYKTSRIQKAWRLQQQASA